MKQKLASLKSNSKTYIRSNILFLAFVGSMLFNSILLRGMSVSNVFAVKPVMADLGFLLVVGSLMYLFKDKKQYLYIIILSFLLSIICVVDSTYYTFYRSFSSVSLIATSLFVIDVGDAVVKNVISYKDFVFLWQPIFLIIVHHILKKKRYYEIINILDKKIKKYVKPFKTGLLIFLIFIFSLTSVEITKLFSQWDREYVLKHYGPFVYHVSDIVKNVGSQMHFLTEKSALEKFDNYYIEYHKDNIKNEYTNKFEGKNVLFIHAESIQTFDMDLSFNGEPLMPNLSKIADEGMFFSNFYSQISVGTSSDTEFTLSTSLLPVINGTVFVNYYDREYVSIQKLLADKGYYTFSMHGNLRSFWNRDVMHPNIGYQDFFGKESFVIDDEIGMGLSDKSFFRQAVSKIKNINDAGQPYMGTLLMLTNHVPWEETEAYGDFPVTKTYETINSANEIVEKTAPFMEGTVLGNYFKAVHYADEAIGQLMVDLEAEGLLDDTIIVIYGDHDARIDKSEYDFFYNYNPLTNKMYDENHENYDEVTYFEYEMLRKVPFIIWSKDEVNPIEVTETMGMYNVLPTLGNMLNIKSPYALGHDIFSDEENIVIFPNTNYVTDKLYYYAADDDYYPLTTEPISNKYIKRLNDFTLKTLDVSNSISEHDLIKKR